VQIGVVSLGEFSRSGKNGGAQIEEKSVYKDYTSSINLVSRVLKFQFLYPFPLMPLANAPFLHEQDYLLQSCFQR